MATREQYLTKLARYYFALFDYCEAAMEAARLRALQRDLKNGAKRAKNEVRRRYGGRREALDKEAGITHVCSCVSWQLMMDAGIELGVSFDADPSRRFVSAFEGGEEIAFCTAVRKRVIHFAAQAEHGREAPLWGPREFLDAYASKLA